MFARPSSAFSLFAVLLPYITGNIYYLHVATVIAVYWVLIATLNLLVGFTGQLSVGHVGLLAIGAYAFCLLAGGQGWNPFLALLAGGAIMRGHRPAAGPAIASSAWLLLRHGDPRIRPDRQRAGAGGTMADQWQRRHARTQLSRPVRHALGFLLAGAGDRGFRHLDDRKPGALDVGTRDGGITGQHGGGISVAVPIYVTKLMVFVFSGFTAGIAGGLYATSQSYITPDAFIVNLGIYFFVAIIIGGRGVIIGPFIGAAVLAAIPELVGPLAKYGTFFYGFILLLVVLLLPGGFGELVTNLAARFGREPQVTTSIEPDLQRCASQ